MLYSEAEYRFPLTKNGILGGVLFVNTVTASDKSAGKSVFYSNDFGYGTGIRVKVKKIARSNFAVDAGLSKHSPVRIYINLQETL
jgi:hypothetical protein